MKELSSVNSIYNIWKEFGKTEDTADLPFQLEIYKKLLRFFQAGDYFYCIFNLNTIGLDFVSANVEQVMGYTSAEFSIDFLLKSIHPDDITWFSVFENESAKFLKTLSQEDLFNYKIQYDLRMRKKNGSYARILFQVVTIQQHTDGVIHRTLALLTDITHLKENGKPKLYILMAESLL